MAAFKFEGFLEILNPNHFNDSIMYPKYLKR